MPLPVIYSDEFMLHDTGDFHPENAGRLTAIRQALQMAPWADRLEWRKPTSTEHRSVLPWIEKLHAPRYIGGLRLLANRGGGHVDADTPISHRSFEVALLAVNAWLDGVEHAWNTGEPVFILARPPGHHAIAERGMGFCLFSNAAIAAHYALEQGVRRVGILDWDVHHGNGTQELVETHPQIAFCSLHEANQYPHTGAAKETGLHNNVLNLPMPAGSTIADYQPLFEQRILPFFTRFAPELLIISAGYDANAADPLANIALQPQDYGVFTDYCLQLTRRLVFGLEGGYDYGALARSVVATIDRCLA